MSDCTPAISFAGVTLDCPEPRALADFYCRLLGWRVVSDGTDWVVAEGPRGTTNLHFQREPAYRPPTWPTTPEQQQMMLHLDFNVEDLDAAHAHALTVGATPMPWQPQEGVWVYADPVGHPFCFEGR